MQSTNSSIDVNSSSQQIEGEINALNKYIETSQAEKKIRREKKNPFALNVDKTATQLNKIAEQQKRYQRSVPTSMDQLLKFIGLTNGTGGPTKKNIRNILLKTAMKSEQDFKTIVQEEALKALGCSQEQIYQGINPSVSFDMDTLPVAQCIYVPCQSLDLITLVNGMLKEDVASPVGALLYEQSGATVQNLSSFRNYGGRAPFPLNNQLYKLTQSNQSFGQIFNNYYRGASGQPLMNIQYTTTNEFGVQGNYYKIALINRQGNETTIPTSLKNNKIGEWLSDYYASIKLFDTGNLTAQILQYVSQFMNMKIPASSGPIGEQSRFYRILQRILGLCFDQKTEIDVSGVAKVAELDGVDDSFFEFTEVDLRNIDLEISNVQNGVIEFVDCDNVKLPVDFNSLTNQIAELNKNSSNLTIEEQISAMERIIDSLSQNPNWKTFIPASFNAEASISDNIIKNLPIAVASAILSPKVLLPLFILLKITESSYALSYNQAVTSATTINQLGIQASNIITSTIEFLKKFKNFIIQVVSKIAAIFIKNLFDLLKKDLLNIITQVVTDILREQKGKEYKQALRLIAIATNLVKGALDYRKCQPLLDEIKNILNLIQQPINPGPPPGKRKKINLALAVLSDFLPGESPQRAFLNTIKYLQESGLPTDALPNGRPNLMLLYNLATHRGRSDEQARNGVNDTYCSPTGLPCWSIPR